VFHRSIGNKVLENFNATAGFFQAIMEFSKLQVGENLEAVSMSDSLFYFSSKRGFTFIFRDERSSPKTREQIAIILNHISEGFFDMFPDAANWDGDTDSFNQFTSFCDDVLLPELTTPEYDLSAEDLAVIPTVMIEEASKQICALIDRANANLLANALRDASDAYYSALRLLIMVPELEPHYPNLKVHLREQCEAIDDILSQPFDIPQESIPETFRLFSHCPICGELVKDGNCIFCGAWVCPACQQMNEVNELHCKFCNRLRLKGPLKMSDFFVYRQK